MLFFSTIVRLRLTIEHLPYFTRGTHSLATCCTVTTQDTLGRLRELRAESDRMLHEPGFKAILKYGTNILHDIPEPMRSPRLCSYGPESFKIARAQITHKTIFSKYFNES